MTRTQDDHPGLLVAGWVMLFVFPLGAVVTGFVIVGRREINGVLLCFFGTFGVIAQLWAASLLFA